MGIFWRLILTAVLAGLTWLSWQPPLPAPAPPVARASLPFHPAATARQDGISEHRPETLAQSQSAHQQSLWRVVTRRVISKEGINALEKRLAAMQLKPLIIQRREDLTMHAFDDAELFHSKEQARAAASFWQKHGIESSVMKAAAGTFMVGLGRFYQVKYAESTQKQLDSTGRKYRYQKRTVPIPVKRYTFPPTDKPAAEALWKKLNITGVIMPVLIPENRFQELYGDSLQPFIATQK